MAITCPQNDTSGVCATMEGAGAGLGVFIQYMGQALPVLLIVLALVGIIVAVGMGIAGVIKKSIHSTHTR
jgi:F0F1-type ATP synthase assembly protein I